MRQILLAASLCLATSLAAAGPWELRTMGDSQRAAVANDDGSVIVSVYCGGDNLRIGVQVFMTVPWLAGQPAELAVDGESYPVVIAEEGDNWVNFRANPEGSSRALLAALKSGSELVLTGAAAADIDAADRTFTLDGSRRALAGVPGGCTG